MNAMSPPVPIQFGCGPWSLSTQVSPKVVNYLILAGCSVGLGLLTATWANPLAGLLIGGSVFIVGGILYLLFG